MVDHIEGLPRTQTLLLPKTLEEYVEQDTPARFINAWVDSQNLQALGFTHTIPNENGAPSYDPKDLIKLHLYGCLNHVRSSRKLERQCCINVEVMWIMRGLRPGFKTIADFRKDNVACIKPLFKEFVKFCMALGLYGAELIGIDGSKFKAVNAQEKCLTQKTLAKRIELIEKSAKQMEMIEKETERFLEELDAADKEEENRAKHAWEDKVKALLRKKGKCEELLKQMKVSGQSEVSLTDPECRLMKNRGRVEPCYNVQAAVDAKNRLIVDYKVTNEATDNHALSPLAKAAKETLEVEHIDVVADAGFSDSLEIKECVDNGITPYVAQQRHQGPKRDVPAPGFSVDKFTYDKGMDVCVCPAGKKLEFFSCAIVNGKKMRIYKSRNDACFSCKFFMTKCSKNKGGRWIWRWEHEEVMDEMRKRLRLHPEVMDKRKEVVEHPFGTVKRAFNAGYLLLKGLRKVDGEVGFTMIAYNMRRALNILGSGALVQAIG
jgi:transposase